MKIRIPIAIDEHGVWCVRAASWLDDRAAEKVVRRTVPGSRVEWVEVEIEGEEIPDGGAHDEE